MSAVLRATQSLCSTCKSVVPAELFVRAAEDDAARDEVWMRKTCEDHGDQEVRYWRDADLFSKLDGVVGDYTWCTTFECLTGTDCDRCVDKSYNIMLEATTRCNLDCPVCCSDANVIYSEPPSIEAVLERLPPARRGLLGRLKRPNIVLFGGEASVRKDLPELIEALVARGYVPRLATNGVRMCDERYLKRLREAGLKWVILQFDGFDDDVSELLRGERLQAMKLEAIEKMTAHGFKVQLGTMMVKGVNTKYAGDLIQYVISHPDVFWLSFYPHAAQARSLLPTKQTFMSEMLAAIEEQTEGRVTPDDFIATLKWLGRAYKVLRLPSLRAKHSTLPMLLMTDGEDYFPLVRLLNPLFALRKLPLVLRLLASLPRVLLYQESYTPPFLKFFVVEKFHSDETVDLEEASNCHMAFMTSRHYVPFDIYNIAYKQAGAWDPPRPRKGHTPKEPQRVEPTLVPASNLRLAQR